MSRPLGRDQVAALKNLARLNGGVWTADCGWQIRTAAYTKRVLDSLVRRGTVSKTSATSQYAITEAGFNALGWWSCAQCTRLTRNPQTRRSPSEGRQRRCSWCTAPAPATPRRQANEPFRGVQQLRLALQERTSDRAHDSALT
ncbi:hypothetical protein [Streptomyces nigrescens]|uniref:hypothetical protein n=1 Tax=Streptomyces nigrescens TaxID=1920 RepID=UPI0036F9D1F0